MVPPVGRRTVWTLAGDDDALVLGSTQAVEDASRARCRAAGIDIVKRHSGGGAVLLRAGDYRWVDVVVPVGDPLWNDDVGRSFDWLSDLWLGALDAVGVTARRHVGPSRFREEGRVACFAAWSPGEILLGDRKLVGMSQRRTRHFARFQSVVYSDYDSESLIALLADRHVDDGLRRRLGQVAVVDDPDGVVGALLEHLP